MHHRKVDRKKIRVWKEFCRYRKTEKQVVGKQLGGTGVVCRSARRMMKEIYSSHSSRHSAQSTLKELN